MPAELLCFGCAFVKTLILNNLIKTKQTKQEKKLQTI